MTTKSSQPMKQEVPPIYRGGGSLSLIDLVHTGSLSSWISLDLIHRIQFDLIQLDLIQLPNWISSTGSKLGAS
ncbi:unnamed protein product, partial [Musa textilis]